MRSPAVGRWHRVGEVLAVFRQMGCDRVNLPDTLDDDGELSHERAILSLETGRFAAFGDLDDADLIPAALIEDWMRQTGVAIPLP